jgi:hypothetical protein
MKARTVLVLQGTGAQSMSQGSTSRARASSPLKSLSISTHGLHRGTGSIRSKETPLRVCCNGMLSAYAHGSPVQAVRAQHLFDAMTQCALTNFFMPQHSIASAAVSFVI